MQLQSQKKRRVLQFRLPRILTHDNFWSRHAGGDANLEFSSANKGGDQSQPLNSCGHVIKMTTQQWLEKSRHNQQWPLAPLVECRRTETNIGHGQTTALKTSQSEPDTTNTRLIVLPVVATT
jgi:hypothetical protein